MSAKADMPVRQRAYFNSHDIGGRPRRVEKAV
jgi:hypothetical protein